MAGAGGVCGRAQGSWATIEEPEDDEADMLEQLLLDVQDELAALDGAGQGPFRTSERPAR